MQLTRKAQDGTQLKAWNCVVQMSASPLNKPTSEYQLCAFNHRLGLAIVPWHRPPFDEYRHPLRKKFPKLLNYPKRICNSRKPNRQSCNL